MNLKYPPVPGWGLTHFIHPDSFQSNEIQFDSTDSHVSQISNLSRNNVLYYSNNSDFFVLLYHASVNLSRFCFFFNVTMNMYSYMSTLILHVTSSRFFFYICRFLHFSFVFITQILYILTHMHTWRHTYMHTWTQTHMHTWTHTNMHTCTTRAHKVACQRSDTGEGHGCRGWRALPFNFEVFCRVLQLLAMSCSVL